MIGKACREALSAKRRAAARVKRIRGPRAGELRDVTAGSESYDDQEAIRLHRERLLWGYHEACARLPRGYTLSFSTWIATIGDAGTIWKDEHWLHANTPPGLAVEWRE